MLAKAKIEFKKKINVNFQVLNVTVHPIMFCMINITVHPFFFILIIISLLRILPVDPCLFRFDPIRFDTHWIHPGSTNI